MSRESIQRTDETLVSVKQATSVTGSILEDRLVFRLPNTMADNVNEESDYIAGKDELSWGYEEGRLVLISM